MPRQVLLDKVYSVKDAVQAIIPYLEDTGRSAHKAIYLDGWDGLAASAVLRAIADNPPPPLRNKFDRIIHIDCSRWKSRRALQRAIAEELKLPQRVMATFDRQDMEDDFSGVHEDSRSEIGEAAIEIYQTTRDLNLLVIFHNGSDNTIDIADFGFPRHDWFSKRIYKQLWTFRGRLRINPEIKQKVHNSHLFVCSYFNWCFDKHTTQLILEEATEATKYRKYKHSMTPEIAAKCISYILFLNRREGSTMDYDWATHASNYWVCDGIIQQGRFGDESWEISAALHECIRLEDCIMYHPTKFCDHKYTENWKSVAYPSENGLWIDTTVSPELTSFFLTFKIGLYISLPREMFQQSERLRVLKLCGCKFSFSLPPFHYCRSLRFLALDHCKDQNLEEEGKVAKPAAMEFLGNLWVLDISHMDWELDLSHDIVEQMALNIREVHIKKGRIWCSNLAWRQLVNLRKLRLIEPTWSWEACKNDEFTHLVKLELLDLSASSTIQVLPSLSSAACLRTLVLDGCVGLHHVGPEGLPPALETFSLDASSNKLSKISLFGCSHLENFLLRGELPGLEELNLSGTSVRRVDLSDKVVQVKGLKKVFLMGCKQLRAILWWEGTRQLEVLCIGTHEAHDTLPCYHGSSSLCTKHKNYVVTGDARIIQSLLIEQYETMITRSIYVDLHVPPTKTKSKGQQSRDEVVILPKPCCYSDFLVEGVSAYGNEMRRPPHLDCHMEVSKSFSLMEVESDKGIKAIHYMMVKHINSLHVHDNSCIYAITPKLPSDGHGLYWFELKWCCVERCPKLETVFISDHSQFCYAFDYLETIWVSDLPIAKSIWSKGTIYGYSETFASLQSIHLYNCPRLKFVLPFSCYAYLPSLETLHIAQCCDLRWVFTWDAHVPKQYREASDSKAKQFPNLKHINLHNLSNLKDICKAKMCAPMLERIMIRGCFALRRLPAVGRRRHGSQRRPPVVECEKDVWTKLEWDGLHAGHHPSLYDPRHSSYYKTCLVRGTVLR